MAEEQLRLAEITPSDDVINHLSDAFSQSLKHIVNARKVVKLPEFKGYTVDERLQQFRKVRAANYRNGRYKDEYIEFVPFDSPKGQKLLEEMRAEKIRS